MRNRANRECASLVTLTDGVLLLEAAFDRHVYERHMHDTYAVGLTLRGVQQFWCRGSIHRSTAHHAIVIAPGEVHDGESGAEGGYAYRMFYLPVDFVERILHDACGMVSARIDGPSPLRADAVVADRLNRASLEFTSGESLGGEELLRDAIVALAVSRSGVPAVPKRLDERALLDVRDYLHAHVHAPVPVAELAARASMSRFQLTRQFQRVFGLPLHAYHMQVRLTEAKHRLGRGESIAAVAASLGFADQSHFHRRFRGFFGVTPDTWRRSSVRS
jgi:AraC-like DNA-binding protein